MARYIFLSNLFDWVLFGLLFTFLLRALELKYRISGVASTHGVEKQTLATVEKLALLCRNIVGLATLAQCAASKRSKKWCFYL